MLAWQLVPNLLVLIDHSMCCQVYWLISSVAISWNWTIIMSLYYKFSSPQIAGFYIFLIVFFSLKAQFFLKTRQVWHWQRRSQQRICQRKGMIKHAVLFQWWDTDHTASHASSQGLAEPLSAPASMSLLLCCLLAAVAIISLVVMKIILWMLPLAQVLLA